MRSTHPEKREKGYIIYLYVWMIGCVQINRSFKPEIVAAGAAAVSACWRSADGKAGTTDGTPKVLEAPVPMSTFDHHTLKAKL